LRNDPYENFEDAASEGSEFGYIDIKLSEYLKSLPKAKRSMKTKLFEVFSDCETHKNESKKLISKIKIHQYLVSTVEKSPRGIKHFLPFKLHKDESFIRLTQYKTYPEKNKIQNSIKCFPQSLGPNIQIFGLLFPKSSTNLTTENKNMILASELILIEAKSLFCKDFMKQDEHYPKSWSQDNFTVFKNKQINVFLPFNHFTLSKKCFMPNSYFFRSQKDHKLLFSLKSEIKRNNNSR